MMETMLGSLSHLVAQVDSQQEERTTGFTEEIETTIAQLRTKADELLAECEVHPRGRGRGSGWGSSWPSARYTLGVGVGVAGGVAPGRVRGTSEPEPCSEP